MYMNKKKLFAVSVIVIMIAIMSFSTLAWFNGKDTVDNKFQIPDNNGDGIADFEVDVKEQETDTDGKPIVDANGDPVWTDNGNTYENIMPGDQLSKLATVNNTGAYDEWIRVNIVITDAEAWTKAIQKVVGNPTATDDVIASYIVNNMLHGFDATQYENNIVMTRDTAADTMMITAYYKQVLAPDASITVMEEFWIPGALEQKDMMFGVLDAATGLYTDTEFSVTVTAEAVQVDNLGATSASEAFALANWEIGTNYGE